MSYYKTDKVKFFEVEKNIWEYIDAGEGIDGRFLIEALKKHLKANSTVLELGMGAGKDLNILNESYNTTGSDNSKVFLEIYRKENPSSKLLLLDAGTLKTNRKFDCIYSNKVLHHLSKEHLKTSLNLQKHLLNQNGILFHTFWVGTNLAKFQDLNFIQYEIDELKTLVEKDYKIIEIQTYQEMNINDSVYMILKIK